MSTRQQSARTRIRRLAIGRLISINRRRSRVHRSELHGLGADAFAQHAGVVAAPLTFGVAGLLGSFAGALGDRFDRRKRDDLVGGDLGLVLRRDGVHACADDPDRSSPSDRRSRSCRSSRLRGRRSQPRRLGRADLLGERSGHDGCARRHRRRSRPRGRSADPVRRVRRVRPQRTDVRRVVGADAHGARELPGGSAQRPRRPRQMATRASLPGWPSSGANGCSGGWRSRGSCSSSAWG